MNHLLQQHHLQTGLLSKHNSFALFIKKEHAMIPPNQNANPYLVYQEYPSAIAFLGVTRKRNRSNFVGDMKIDSAQDDGF